MRRTLGTCCCGKRIVWVDDHPDNNRIPRRLLEDGGAALVLALSTKEASSLLERPKDTVHLVISDMGRGDDQLAGIELLEYLRKATIQLPVIIYSDNPMADARREEIRRLGGIGPILGPENLIECISRLFNLTDFPLP